MHDVDIFPVQYGYHSKAWKMPFLIYPKLIFSIVGCAVARNNSGSGDDQETSFCTANLARESRVIYARKAAYAVKSSCLYCHSYRWWESMQCIKSVSSESDHHAVLYQTWIQSCQYLLDLKLGKS